MTDQLTKSKRGRLKNWSTRDILVTAVIGAVFRLLLIPIMPLYSALIAIGPLVTYATMGLYKIPALSMIRI